MQLASDNPHVKYAGTIFAACGIYPNVPQGVAWNGKLRTLLTLLNLARMLIFGQETTLVVRLSVVSVLPCTSVSVTWVVVLLLSSTWPSTLLTSALDTVLSLGSCL